MLCRGTLAQCRREGRCVLRTPWLCGEGLAGAPRGLRSQRICIARPPGRSRRVVRAAVSRLLHRVRRRRAHTLQCERGRRRLAASRAAGRGDFVGLFF